jgi:hypothetical protein
MSFMSDSFVGDTENIAVSQCAERNKQREVLTKQVNAGQQTVVATEPSQRDGGSLEAINVLPVIKTLPRILVRKPGDRPICEAGYLSG